MIELPSEKLLSSFAVRGLFCTTNRVLSFCLCFCGSCPLLHLLSSVAIFIQSCLLLQLCYFPFQSEFRIYIFSAFSVHLFFVLLRLFYFFILETKFHLFRYVHKLINNLSASPKALPMRENKVAHKPVSVTFRCLGFKQQNVCCCRVCNPL